MALLRASGAKVTRLDVLWSLVAPRRPREPARPRRSRLRLGAHRRDPARDRGERRHADRRRLQRPRMGGGRAGGAGRDRGESQRPRRRRTMRRFMEALARRYSGSHRSAQGRRSPLPRVRHFEIWNEPNLAGFLSPQVSGGRRVAVSRYIRDGPAGLSGDQAGESRRRSSSRGRVARAARATRAGTGALAWARAARPRAARPSTPTRSTSTRRPRRWPPPGRSRRGAPCPRSSPSWTRSRGGAGRPST